MSKNNTKSGLVVNKTFGFLLFWSFELLCMNPMARHDVIRQSTGLTTRCVTLVNDYVACRPGQGYLLALSPNRERLAFVTPSDGFCALYNTRRKAVEKITRLKKEGTPDYVKSVEFADNITLMALVGPSYDQYQGKLFAYTITNDAPDCIEGVLHDKDVVLLQRSAQGWLMLYSRITENCSYKAELDDTKPWDIATEERFEIINRQQSAWVLSAARTSVIPAAQQSLVSVPEFRRVEEGAELGEDAVGLSLSKNPELGFIRPGDWALLRTADELNIVALLSQEPVALAQEGREVRLPAEPRCRKFARQGSQAVFGVIVLGVVAHTQCVIE